MTIRASQAREACECNRAARSAHELASCIDAEQSARPSGGFGLYLLVTLLLSRAPAACDALMPRKPEPRAS